MFYRHVCDPFKKKNDMFQIRDTELGPEFYKSKYSSHLKVVDRGSETQLK